MTTPSFLSSGSPAAATAMRTEEMLLEKENSGAPLQIKRTSKAVEGTDESEKQESALVLGKSHELSAH